MSEAPVGTLNETELQFVTFMHQCFSLTGEVLSKEQAFDKYAFTPKTYDKLMSRQPVRLALLERGVDLDKYSIDPESKHGWKAQALSPIQLLVANSMLDLVDTRSMKKKLQDLNVSTATYQSWLVDPVFQKYMRDRAEGMLGETQHEAHLALLDRVRSGDIRAIAYYNQMTGRFNPEPNGKSADSVAVDVQNLLVRILEIINDEVDDPNTAFRIAERFKGLVTARTIAGELMADPIVVPEIAEVRELSPKLQSVMDKGQGF